MSDNNWIVKIKNCWFISFNTISGLKIKCKKGNINKNSIVEKFYFIENLKIDESIEKFDVDELKNLKLIKSKHELFPNVDGYFYIKQEYNENQNLIEDLYHVLKYYSAKQAILRIEYIMSKDKYFEFNCYSTSPKLTDFPSNFYVNDKKNLVNFINSFYKSYHKNNYDDLDINSIIHFMSIINGNYEFDYLISALLLETFVNLKITDNSNNYPLGIKLNDLLNRLNLDITLINDFFKENDIPCKKDKYLNKLTSLRQRIIHDNLKPEEKDHLFLTTFVTIISLSLFNIDCLMYLPLLNEVIETKQFVNNFKNSNITESLDKPKFDKVKIIKKDDKLYLPLEFIIKNNFKVETGEKFELMIFKTMNNDKCMKNIKFRKYMG